jgi:hypothetical protein
MPWILMVVFWLGLLASLWMLFARRSRVKNERQQEGGRMMQDASGA